MALATDSGFPHAGEVDYASNKVDASTGTFEGRAVFDNPDGVLLPGLFVRLRVPFSRGRGLLLGIEIVKSCDSKEPDDARAEAIMYRALDAGLSFKTTMGNVLTLTPPLTVTHNDMFNALDIIEMAIRDAQASL